MHNYVGCECPVCKQALTEQDDIVVCSECGAPYHRDCYEKQGECVYRPMHGGGFEWHRPAAAKPPVICPACGTHCDPDNIFCTQCGQPLHGEAPQPQAEADGAAVPGAEFFGAPQPFEFTGSFDGIPASEWATYIGASAPYYLYHFRRQDENGNKIGFTLSAAFFAPYYFFYRKVWLVGILAVLLNVGLSIPGMLAMLVEAGAALPFTINTLTLSRVVSVTSVLITVINALWGVFAVAIYRWHSAKVLHRWKREAPSEEAYQMRLRAKAGPCRAVLYALIIFSFFTMFSTMFGAFML